MSTAVFRRKIPSLDRHTGNSPHRGRYGRVLATPNDESRSNDSVTVCVDTDREPHQSLDFRSWRSF
ncbi:hypothetical protein PILCRDRAFT_828835, partial [Piloderma croceum F 1598]